MFRTKEQKKELCAGCPIARSADIMGDTWSLLIVRDLFSGGKRFGDFERSLSGISTRTLAKKLKLLEKNGIVRRNVLHKKNPGTSGAPRVEYSLTAKGRDLNKIISAMRAYGEKHA